MSIMVGDHVILGTPTGSGKSLVALGMHFIAMCFGERSYYTAPIKALVSEKFFNLVDILGRENVGMITGDVHINTSAPVICCTEEILANQALAEGKDAPIESVAMDEFHFFSDSDRGWAWQVPLLALPNVQFLLMSATLGDVDQIAGLLERQTGKDVSRIIDAPRPVPLSYEYALTSLEGTVELALRKGEGPLYIVHFSQDAALSSASALASYGVATKEQREAVKEAMKGARFTTAFGKTLKRLLGCRCRRASRRDAAPLSPAGGKARPAGCSPRHLRNRHARRGHQCAHPHRCAHRAHEVRRPQDAPSALARVPPDRRARRAIGLRHRRRGHRRGARARDREPQGRGEGCGRCEEAPQDEEEETARELRQLERGHLQPLGGISSREAYAPHARHSLDGARRGGAGGRRPRPRGGAHCRLAANRRGEGGALAACRRGVRHAHRRGRGRERGSARRGRKLLCDG